MNEFMKLKQEQSEYLHRNSGHLLENDCRLNELNRRLIDAFKKHAGTVFIGSINNYDPDPAIILKEYTWQYIYNFDCDFCIPSFDEILVRLITEWNQTNKVKVLNEIYTRIEHLGGVILTWT